ncbi:MAG: hypothetical protein VSS52_007495, partial [Thiotrichaceae bacterium]|nr:hypothetical protein [Thiotrichaceae bacterium]
MKLRKNLLSVAIASILVTTPFALQAAPSGKIEVCKNGKTSSVSANALSGQLNAGATEGACAVTVDETDDDASEV